MKQRFSTRTRLVSALLTLAMVFTFLPFSAFADDEVDYWVPLHNENFPDETFLEYVRTTFDKGGGGWDDGEPNGILEPDEHKTVYTIDVSGMNITSLSGISVFHNLKNLYCSNNQLTSLDLSYNTKLTQANFECTGNKYPIIIDVTERTFDLSLLPAGFDVTKASGWAGGTVVGNTLRVKPGATQVTYTYDCGNGLTAQFALTVNEDTTDGGNISLIEIRFPDDTFREYLRRFDTNNTNILSLEERKAVTEIDVSGMEITSLKGIEFFPNLKNLTCYDNQLTELDVSQNKKLERLYCFRNQLTELDVSQNTALIELRCEHNPLTKLDVSKNTALKMLACEKNQLTSLDVSKNTALEKLYCSQNQLTKLDVSKNSALWHLSCYENQLTELDVSQNQALEELYCHTNQLTSLDVSKNTKLSELECSQNQLTKLDVSKNTALEKLYCYSNQLTSLDVSQNTNLAFLSCDNNKIDINIEETSRTFDLSTLPGFDVTKATNWKGGTVNGSILTVDNGATEVTYSYDCGRGWTRKFSLQVLTRIKQVNIRVNTPKKHEMPDETVVILDNGADVCDVKIRWGKGDIGGEPIPGTFRPGTQYTLQVGLYAKPGYKFSEETVCTVNGREAKFLMTLNDDTEYYAIKHYSVPLSPGGFEHDHKMEMTHDEHSHWKECPICHTVQDTEAHVYDDDKDTTCNVCGYVRSLTPGGTPGGSTPGGDNPGGGSTPGGSTPGGGSTGGGDGGGAIVIVAAAGAAVAGVVGYGVYNYVSGQKLQALLPEGVAAPENRAQTALLLWNTAGRPEPAEAPAFADVADPDTAKAAQWCVEQGLMKRRLNGKFAPGSSIPAYQVLNAYRKLAG